MVEPVPKTDGGRNADGNAVCTSGTPWVGADLGVSPEPSECVALAQLPLWTS